VPFIEISSTFDASMGIFVWPGNLDLGVLYPINFRLNVALLQRIELIRILYGLVPSSS